MRILGSSAVVVLVWMASAAVPFHAASPTVEAPDVLLTGIPFTLKVQDTEAVVPIPVEVRDALGGVLARGEIAPRETVSLPGLIVGSREQLPLSVVVAGEPVALERPLLPGWVTILPPLIAIALALLTHEVFSSLFAGVWLGCLFLSGYQPVSALLMTVGRVGRNVLSDSDHAAIVMFTLLLGGMVGVMSRMGASAAIVEAVTPIATSRRRGQFATWLAGLLIFFDDYANTLIVGSTMRPLMDRLKVSREKLAYIVDSTAAPVAALMFVSTWVGFEISLIGDGLKTAAGRGLATPDATPFSVFIDTIPFLFYPLLALFMVLMIVVMRRDFGPMHAAEQRAARGEGVFRPGAQVTAAGGEMEGAPDGVSSRWWQAAIPILVVIVTVVAGLIRTGLDALPEGAAPTASAIFGNADPFTPLLWGSLLGCLAAMGIAVGGRKLRLDVAVQAWVAGLRSMLLACIVLVMAWSLGEVTESLGTAGFLASALSDRMPEVLLPAAVFIVAALISFATGTSWATMAILFPLTIPLALALSAQAGDVGPLTYQHLLGAIAGVMAGSLFGDHCSPISDTTVMSSMASGCDHVDHVRTQLPYALVTAGLAAIGTLVIGFGVSPWPVLAALAVAVALVVRFVGKR